ncbi:predicted protein [Chaetoceros tenuissimus]|uniref:Uncharacterized protein n=1 Tax=Chaetoceros tenuissimus TaxID=426638 RepID=A0AAD3HG33_9STRA|nr:predicted protein [Chaetoceros tenuissimus]
MILYNYPEIWDLYYARYYYYLPAADMEKNDAKNGGLNTSKAIIISLKNRSFHFRHVKIPNAAELQLDEEERGLKYKVQQYYAVCSLATSRKADQIASHMTGKLFLSHKYCYPSNTLWW